MPVAGNLRLLCSRVILPAALLVATPGTHASEPTFERDVLPILTSHCLACHGGVTQKNGLDMRTHASFMRGGNNGSAVTPGQVDKSLLWQKIHKDDMPRNDNKVSASDKEIIRKWIETGARSSRVARQFEPLAKASSPAAVAKRIDQIIHEKLTAAKIPVSPLADDSEFLRSQAVGIPLKPSASYVRLYQRGSVLHKHLDRPDLEHTLSITLGKNVPIDWPLFAEDRHKQTITLTVPVGAGAMLSGRRLPHWREPLECAGDEYVVQLFLHWS